MDIVYLGIPSHHGMLDYRSRTALRYFDMNCPANLVRVNLVSLLCFNFNQMFADALNMRRQGVTHFMLLHDDIIPEGNNWATALLAEMRDNHLDVLSVSIPLRNDSGETSTALDGKAADGSPLRLTTWATQGSLTSRDHPDLLINTGLLLIDLSKPWVEEFHFQTHDEIARLPDGTFEARCVSEDWLMSRWLRERKIAFGATGKVKAMHLGRTAWKNYPHDAVN